MMSQKSFLLLCSSLLSLGFNSSFAAEGTAETLYSGTQPIKTELVDDNGLQRYTLKGVTQYGVPFETRSGGNSRFGQYSIGLEIFDGDNDNHWNDFIDNSSTSTFPRASLDVHWGVEKTLDFFQEVLGISSFDDNGGIVIGNAHSFRQGAWEYQNGVVSFSDTTSFGEPTNPWVSIDLVAHEIAHSLLDVIAARPAIERLPSIVFEGFPDVIGISVRHYAKPDSANFEFADEIYVNPGNSLRSLSNPVVDTYLGNDWNLNQGIYERGGLLGKWFYLASVGGAGTNELGDFYNVTGNGTENAVKALYDAFDIVSGEVTVEALAAATVEAARGINADTVTAVSQAWQAVGVEMGVIFSSMRRTVVFIFGETTGGQDLFIRGGIDHGYANNVLGRNCQSDNFECALPIVHNNLINDTTSPWKHNDTFLDWYGTQQGQSAESEGTPLDWTTNFWPSEWGQTRTVDTDGYGLSPLNTFGMHYWMLDVQMDCTATVDSWFELKSYVSNGPGWENDVNQPDAPYASGNHFAQCGKLNVFRRGESNPVAITDLF